MPLDQKDLEQVTEALGKKFNEFKEKNDKEIEKTKSELGGRVDGLAEELKALQSLKDEIDEGLKKMGRMSNNNGESPEVKEHKEAFGKFMRKGSEDGLMDLQEKALQIGVDADGGYAVPEELDRDISKRLTDDNVMRQVCRVITVGGAEYKKLVSVGGAGSGWVGETDSRPATGTPQLKQITPFMGEIYANPQSTQTMLDDAFFDVESWLAEEVMEEFADQEEAAFTSGNGTNKPKGFLAYTTSTDLDAARAFGQLQHKLSGAAGTITADDIKTFPMALRKKYRAGAVWMGNGATLTEVMKLKTSDGQYLWTPGLEDGVSASLGSYRYMENESMPDMAAGANALSFGNFQRGYYIVDRMGTRVLRDPFTNKPNVGFYTTKRVGGMLVDDNAIKILKIAA
jgi:HK97 family phage major capsid protein